MNGEERSKRPTSRMLANQLEQAFDIIDDALHVANDAVTDPVCKRVHLVDEVLDPCRTTAVLAYPGNDRLDSGSSFIAVQCSLTSVTLSLHNPPCSFAILVSSLRTSHSSG
jgi:hypothetical protein